MLGHGLTFEPDPDHSPDAGTRLLSPISYRLRNFAALPRLPATCAATRNFTSGKSHNPTYMYWLERAVDFKGFYSPSRRKTFVGVKCALLSALLVLTIIMHNKNKMSVNVMCIPLLLVPYTTCCLWQLAV